MTNGHKTKEKMAEVVIVTSSKTGEIMKSYLTQIDVIYNDMTSPIGGSGRIVEKYPDWLEENTLWKVNTRNKSFLNSSSSVPAYCELTKASYLELFLQDTLPDWTEHQFKRYDLLLSNYTLKRLSQLIEEERKIELEAEKEKEKEKEVNYTKEDLEFNELDLDNADLIEADMQIPVLDFEEQGDNWLFRYLFGFFSF